MLVAGPTTFAALLNSLRMGFRTLAIEKRSSEVWKVLSAVKTEFQKFGEILQKVKRKVDTVRKTLNETDVRNRQIALKLREVETLSESEAEAVLQLPEPASESPDETEADSL